jgi:rhodanese-related sulfurtransferase
MLRILLILLAVSLVVSCMLYFGQSGSRAYRIMLGGLLKHTVPEIEIPEAVRQKNAIFLDARELCEYEVSHIEGALHIGYDHFVLKSVAHLPKDTPVIVYCSVGYRSEKIAAKMTENGFTRVSNLYGGIFEWVNEGHPVVRNGMPTEEVHAFSKAWGIWLRRGTKVY